MPSRDLGEKTPTQPGFFRQFKAPTKDIEASVSWLVKRVPEPRDGKFGPEVPIRQKENFSRTEKIELKYISQLVNRTFDSCTTHVLEYYLDLICSTCDARVDSRSNWLRSIDLGLESTTTSGRLASPKCVPTHIFGNDWFGWAFRNDQNRSDGTCGPPSCSQRWKELYPQLKDGGMRKWFKYIEHMFIPMTTERSSPIGHQIMLVISPINKTVEYFDSLYPLGGRWERWILKAFEYIKYEIGGDFIQEEWSFRVNSCPRQPGSSLHCVPCTATHAWSVAFGYPLLSTSYDVRKEIPIKRRRMAHELLRQKLDLVADDEVPVWYEDAYCGIERKEDGSWVQMPAGRYRKSRDGFQKWSPDLAALAESLVPGKYMSWTREQMLYEAETRNLDDDLYRHISTPQLKWLMLEYDQKSKREDRKRKRTEKAKNTPFPAKRTNDIDLTTPEGPKTRAAAKSTVSIDLTTP